VANNTLWIPTKQSAQAFAQLTKQYHPQGAGHFPLTNFTFWLGAGFSKSWADPYPVGAKLFEVPAGERRQLDDVERAASFESASLGSDLTISDIRQMIYSIDMNLRYPTIRSRYLDKQNLHAVKRQLAAYFCRRFQGLVHPHWYWFDETSNKFALPANLTKDQRHIQSLFAKMFELIDGSQGVAEGARFNFMTTNYDWLVEAIIDSVTSDDDTSLQYLYRGVTPSSVCGKDTPRVVHDHWLVFNLLKINGGFEIFPSKAGYEFDYREKTAEDYVQNPPTLMFPSREQDYMSDYFNAVFPKAVRLLQESRFLTIVGYSLPEDDALLRFILRQFCEDRADATRKVLFYISPSPEAEQFQRVQQLFPFAGKDLKVVLYSGGFAKWAYEVVKRL
jgi:hypothetical protein